VPTARAVLKAVEPYDLFFFEEPLPYTNPWGYAELRRSTSVPIAGGECLTMLEEFRQYADLDALTIAQPDAAWVGGLEEFMKIARMFDSRKHKIATHSWGAGVAQMQNIHAGFAAPNTVILEIPPSAGPLHTELWGDSFVMRDGYVLPPSVPGLGVRLTDEVKAKYAFIPGTGEFNSVPGKVLTT
jgi:L-alanine-DL-glutamate epimerase-like enolase superfamily enzyme